MNSIESQVNRVLNEVFANRNYRRLEEFMTSNSRSRVSR